jgi:hypothetical protein
MSTVHKSPLIVWQMARYTGSFAFNGQSVKRDAPIFVYDQAAVLWKIRQQTIFRLTISFDFACSPLVILSSHIFSFKMMLEAFISMLRYLSAREDDDTADRLNYLYTPNMLLAFSVLISFKQFGGRPLECIFPSKFSSSLQEASF